MPDNTQLSISQRVMQVRLEQVGVRGKAGFSRMLGISASTYDYYEAGRTPPAELLVKISEVTGADLRWLLTGCEPEEGAVAPTHPAIRRAIQLLDQHESAADALAAFVEILEATLAFPQKESAIASVSPSEPGTSALPTDLPTESVASTPIDPEGPREHRDWIPILGRSAAGIPAFWASDSEAVGITTLGELIGQHAAQIETVATAKLLESPEGGVQIITLRQPFQPDGPVEYIASPQLKQAHPDAFALRIDGESMSPEIRHGDLVVLSPSQPAASGHSAVVQLLDSIGVTCKLYQPDGDQVHLVAINEQFPVTHAPTDQVEWAFRVLYRIHP
jgi:transcriptional regulator with XRE-family HTH domain